MNKTLIDILNELTANGYSINFKRGIIDICMIVEVSKTIMEVTDYGRSYRCYPHYESIGIDIFETDTVGAVNNKLVYAIQTAVQNFEKFNEDLEARNAKIMEARKNHD